MAAAGSLNGIEAAEQFNESAHPVLENISLSRALRTETLAEQQFIYQNQRTWP